jgi:hypothetical protein
LGGHERPQLGFLCFQAERLVFLVGGAADVDRDPAWSVVGGVGGDAPGASGSGHEMSSPIQDQK